MTVVGWHAYEPALQSKTMLTSTGGGAWTSYLFRKLEQNGNTIIWLGDGAAPKHTQAGKLRDCQVVVCAWRWQMPGYADRNKAYNKQMGIIDSAEMYGIPVLIHDEDYKISDEDARFLKKVKAKIARPELYPQRGVISLIFPNPYSEEPATNMPLPGMRKIDLAYIGNNYERYEQAKLFLAPFSAQFSTAVFGNWMDPSPYRQTAEEVKKDFPGVYFCGRIPQENVISTLQSSRSTIHLFKPEYGEHGFVTIRWAEANFADCPAFVPDNFHLPKGFASQLQKVGMLVHDGCQMAESYNELNEERILEANQYFHSFVRKYMSADRWMEAIYDVKMRKA